MVMAEFENGASVGEKPTGGVLMMCYSLGRVHLVAVLYDWFGINLYS